MKANEGDDKAAAASQNTDKNSGSRKGVCDVNFVNLNFAKTVKVLEAPQHAKKDVKDLTALNIEKVKQKEEEAIKERKLRLEKGISEEGIRLYQTLTKTLKCTWQDKTIHVEGVLIDPPYRVENCKITNPNPNTNTSLEYIKKIVVKHYVDQQNGS
ncbi:hypothetical protein BSL78_00655 [Apostichopus japonicus]|uniref:AD domain-containing protein n=1 Tax=Stichopus japonicus TaxID=307972 RepID=A0A2G8LQD8_STIJA|nr:hypothetical protein BSL78_00655 [Apostichopus japonicus]